MSAYRASASANHSVRTPKSKDRSALCTFTYSDGRYCRTPRRSGHPFLCAFHERKEAQALAGDRAGEDIARYLSGDFISACDLSSALGRLFSAVAQGHVKSKTASTLAYLGQTLVQTLHLSRQEYVNTFGTNEWRREIRSSFAQPEPQLNSNSPSPDTSLPASKRDFVNHLESTLTKVYENKPL